MLRIAGMAAGAVLTCLVFYRNHKNRVYKRNMKAVIQEFDLFRKSELIDFVILQQDAFDEVDSVTPMERQEAILNMIIDICHTEFEFENFNEVMDYFKKMINVCKQMNYSKFKSEQYEGFQQQLKELIAERSVK